MTASIARRRFLAISAAGAGLQILLPGAVAASAAPQTLLRWSGLALGARSEILLNMPERARARTLIERVVSEIKRLERIFSLYRSDSAISRLNQDGHLGDPAPEFVELLSHAAAISEATGGHFDITVQPLWQLYSNYGDGPISERLQRQVLKLVDYRAVEVDRKLVRFARRGMAITLNGIAQGYITDKVTRLLRNQGLDNTLVQLGETRALGTHPSGRPWLIGIENPAARRKSKWTLPLENQALATSGGYGGPLAGPGNHIFNPHNGQSPGNHESLTVVAGNAATADALSTGFISMPESKVKTVLESYPGVSVHPLKSG
ncbi:MAG: FAD:protein FMN transferase [Alphaproteobacteria bacterium]|nr:FAD:protein FMN transferase [Alphaproteobacteria bacterium]